MKLLFFFNPCLFPTPRPFVWGLSLFLKIKIGWRWSSRLWFLRYVLAVIRCKLVGDNSSSFFYFFSKKKMTKLSVPVKIIIVMRMTLMKTFFLFLLLNLTSLRLLYLTIWPALLLSFSCQFLIQSEVSCSSFHFISFHFIVIIFIIIK